MLPEAIEMLINELNVEIQGIDKTVKRYRRLKETGEAIPTTIEDAFRECLPRLCLVSAKSFRLLDNKNKITAYNKLSCMYDQFISYLDETNLNFRTLETQLSKKTESAAASSGPTVRFFNYQGQGCEPPAGSAINSEGKTVLPNSFYQR